MPQPFSRTLRALDADDGRRLWAVQALLIVCGALWFSWFLGARVKVFARSDQARLEASKAGHRVQAPVSGYVVAVHESLEDVVDEGEVLLRLDASAQRHKLEQARAERTSASAQLAAVRREIAAGWGALATQRRASEIHVAEAALREQSASALAHVRARESARSQDLLRAGAVSESIALRASSDAEQQDREASALSVARDRVAVDRRLDAAERAQSLTELQTRAITLEGRLATLDLQIRELEDEIALRVIRAPIRGRIGDVATLTVGAFVQAGEQLALVIPEGGLRMVAQFPPDQALGRIHRGQPGRLQLTGFPFTQYGSVPGVVERVAHEVRDGSVRVELTLDAGAPPIPLQHALPGTLQIELDEVAPATLAWRAVGRSISKPEVAKP